MTEPPVNTCLIGDVRAVLPTLPANSVNCCVTSPPYWGLRDYGAEGQLGLEPTPEAYVEQMVAVFREVRRVLRDDGTLWLNLGDSYAGSWGAQSRTDASPDVTRGASKISAGSSIQAAPRGLTGTGSLSRTPGLKNKDLVGIPWRVAFALQADGWWLRSDIVWAKPNPMPESVTDRPTKAHELVFLLSKSETYHFDAGAIREPLSPQNKQRGARQMSKRASLRLPGRGEAVAHYGLNDCDESIDRNARTVWTIPTEPYHGAHFACFPRQLAQRCILAGCPLGGTVLDCFFGSGTTGQVAEELGRKWLGVELNPDYEPLWRERTKQQGLAFGGGS